MPRLSKDIEREAREACDPFPPSQAHSPTSIAAAVAVANNTATLRARLLAWLRRRGVIGATDEEGIGRLAMASSTYRPRRVELVRMGLVADSGRVRKTRSNRNAVVWVARTVSV